MTISYQTLSGTAYDNQLYTFIKNMEEGGNVSLTTYDDGEGHPTIGIGYNLDEPSIRNAVVEEISGLSGSALSALQADVATAVGGYRPSLYLSLFPNTCSNVLLRSQR